MEPRAFPMRSAKKLISPATGPQVPHTLVLLTRTSSPHDVSSSITSEKGITLASSSCHSRSSSRLSGGRLRGSSRSSERKMEAMASAASSMDLTSTPRSSAHAASASSSKTCRGRP
jgi:hypothetical protein